jgi:hypothetical protein
MGYWIRSPDSVGSREGEMEGKVPCRDAYPLEGSWFGKSAGAAVEGTLV